MKCFMNQFITYDWLYASNKKSETLFYTIYFIKQAFKGIVHRLSFECGVKS